MSDDEAAIRALIATWISASEAGDTDTVLSLMTDDVVFLTPGKPPFGKAEFAAAFRGMAGIAIRVSSEIRELAVVGPWAYVRSALRVTVTPPDGQPVTQSGDTLTIVRKEADGRWRLARDANVVMREGG